MVVNDLLQETRKDPLKLHIPMDRLPNNASVLHFAAGCASPPCLQAILDYEDTASHLNVRDGMFPPSDDIGLQLLTYLSSFFP